MSTTTCPLCGYEAEQTVVYRHLQTSHRKSALSRELLDDVQIDSERDGRNRAPLELSD